MVLPRRCRAGAVAAETTGENPRLAGDGNRQRNRRQRQTDLAGSGVLPGRQEYYGAK